MKQIFISIIFVSLVLLSTFSGAANVSWTTDSFEAAACADDFTCQLNSNRNIGPPLPVSASEVWYFDESENSSAFSSITTSVMQISADRVTTVAGAEALFLGTFYSSQPYFAFTYNLTSDGTTNWLRVDDLTDSSSLFDQNLSDGSSTIYVPVISGHEIQVDFGLSGGFYTLAPLAQGSKNATMSYSMAVVPEPISSILFIVGGATLGFRRYMRRRQ